MIFFSQDMLAEHYKGGAELTSEAIIDGSLFPVNKVLTSHVTTDILEKNKDSFWVFGNFANLSESCMLYAAKNLRYSVIEYDYKYCKYRLPETQNESLFFLRYLSLHGSSRPY